MHMAKAKLIFTFFFLCTACVSTPFTMEQTAFESESQGECDKVDETCVVLSRQGLTDGVLGVRQTQLWGLTRPEAVFEQGLKEFFSKYESTKSPQIAAVVQSLTTQTLMARMRKLSCRVQEVSWQKYLDPVSRLPKYQVSVLYLIPKEEFETSLSLVLESGRADKIHSQFFKSIQWQPSKRKS